MAFSAIGGNVDFGGAPDMDFANPERSYKSAYTAAANINRQLYDAQMSGHAKRIQEYQTANQGLIGGYRGLQKAVMRQLAGTNRANLTDIADRYTALSGQMSQQLIDRGLGNTTVQQSVQRGVEADFSKESTRSNNLFAQLQAQTRSNLGQARLAAMERGMGFLSGLQGDQLAMMERVSAPYPDAGLYAQLAQMGGGGGGMGMSGLPGLPGPSRGNAPTGGYGPRGSAFFDVGGGFDAGPMSGVNLNSGIFSGGGGNFSSIAADPGYSVLPGYEQGMSGYGPYTPPGSYPRAEAVFE